MTSEPHATHPLAPYAAFAGCCAIWGSTFLFISMGNDTVPPLWAATLRLGLASLLLVALTRLTGRSLPRGPALYTAAGLATLIGPTFAGASFDAFGSYDASILGCAALSFAGAGLAAAMRRHFRPAA